MFTTNLPRRRAGNTAAVAVLLAALLAPSLTAGASAVTGPIGPELFPRSFFDHSIASRPVAPESATLVYNLVQQIQGMSSGNVGINALPIFTVPATQPKLTIQVQSSCKDFVDGIPGGTGPVPIPANGYPTSGTDHTMDVYQPSTDTGWELWRVQAPQQPQDPWSACWGGSIHPAVSSGVFAGHYGSSASGLSYLATAVTEQDVASGQIHHALALQIPACNGHTAPASRSDSTGCNVAGAPPEGAWFRMPYSVPMPAGLTPFAQLVFRALQTFGVVVFDRAGVVMLQAEDPQDWAFEGNAGIDPITNAFGTTNGVANPEWAVLSGIPWSSLQVICAPKGAIPCLT